jgi:uncharacterized RDD family membrane protein YckC
MVAGAHPEGEVSAQAIPEPGAFVPAPAETGAVPPSVTDLRRFPRGTFLDRMAAFALDFVLVLIVLQFARPLFNPLIFLGRGDDGTFFLVLLVYHLAFWAWKGTTLGGIIVGLRVARADGAPFTFPDALVRSLSGVFSVAALGIGCLWMLGDAERQMWHDKVAGTYVVKVPRTLAV